MKSDWHEIDGYRVDDAAGVPGIGQSDPLRFTRCSDGASVLLHEISRTIQARFHLAEFHLGCPDFSRPFVTRFAGILNLGDRVFLVEPLPRAVPLLSVWSTVLGSAPRNALKVFQSLSQQLRTLSDNLRHRSQIHGAMCAENIVLTTSGTYGLLQSRLRIGEDWETLRPLRPCLTEDQMIAPSTLENQPDSVALILQELAQFAIRSKVLTLMERGELESLSSESPPESSIPDPVVQADELRDFAGNSASRS